MEDIQIAEPVDEPSAQALQTRSQALPEQDEIVLAQCVEALEYPSLIARISDKVAMPIEFGLMVLPDWARTTIAKVSRKAIEKALDLALFTMDTTTAPGATPPAASDGWHTGAAAASGAAGGFFGLPSMLIEIPLSTSIMLRSIADIARSEGEDLSDVTARLECVSVFAMGGNSDGDDGAELGYFLAREAMASMIARTSAYYEAQLAAKLAENAAKVAAKGAAKTAAKLLAKEAAEAAKKAQSTTLVKLMETIAARYSGVISESAMAKFLPLVGAALGATINSLFISHYQDVARAHFRVRRLERSYGDTVIRGEYARIAEQLKLERKPARTKK
ncbi:MAG TPA: EcsC family protein [Pseudoxanthomonas sp.]|nr:EcsC family protein [Pseudoxanthomonas sp.]